MIKLGPKTQHAINKVLAEAIDQTGSPSNKRSYSNRIFWAKLTSDDGGSPRKYTWTEQTEDTHGNLIDMTDGRAGTPMANTATNVVEDAPEASGIVLMVQTFDKNGDVDYRFYAGSQISWVKITTPMPYTSSPDGGGGWYNCTILKGNPTDLDPTGDVIIPDTGESESSDDAGLAQNISEANLGNPAVNWVPREEWVLAIRIGMSNEDTPRSTYRFDYPRQVFTLKITDVEGSMGGGGGGSYLAKVGTGRVNVASSRNFTIPDPDQSFDGPDVIWRNLGEAGTGTSGSNVVAIGSLVIGYLEGYDGSTPAKSIYYGCAGPSATLFLCALTARGETRISVTRRRSMPAVGGRAE
jgi:hypothetical protein